jgi:diguanylate cyclase (GGDEF)-like protein
VLTNLTEIIQSQLRSTDIVARWGGDEFVILFPETSLEAAVKVTERIRSLVEENLFFNGISVTCCFGVADMKDRSDFYDILGEADRLMYSGKQLNKNRIMCAGKKSAE